ncbi:hypothetical protein MHM83_01055 [Tenacibaculum sp. Mcav3-52]|uniref:hypothetical protein n=1 Tax=Tenacibaculum sp. Mcav3-52 TaxID=2917762 RepID=UPI001EF32A1E|nr:hypothetical protein [Tenacibaculum sp. Mcav3-52]MCG7500449.1 hypothetical protein [Tenacibaculum sp. Mcav3-52]
MYAYVGDSNSWVDVFGLAPWERGGFKKWWDTASESDVKDNLKSVKNAMRAMHGGGNHEMFPVSQAVKAKKLGFSYDELSERTIKTSDVFFENVPDGKGSLLSGPHVSSGVNNSPASARFHKELITKLKAATSKQEAKNIISEMHGKYVKKLKKINCK